MSGGWARCVLGVTHDESFEKTTPWEGDDKEETRYYGSDPEMSEITPKRRHMFSHGNLGSDRTRHHRRKPLARNWSRARKRVTAVIACINTFTLGYIIGQYVSHDASYPDWRRLLTGPRLARCLRSSTNWPTSSIGSSLGTCCKYSDDGYMPDFSDCLTASSSV